MDNLVNLFIDNGYCLCKANEEANDIFESGNVILTFGKTLIEIFRFIPAENNNNNNPNNNNQNNKNKLKKKK